MINSLCITISAYVLVFLSLLGWGQITSSTLKIEFPSDITIFANVWLGFSTMIFVIQVLHIGLPISFPLSICVLAVGLWSSLRWIIKKKHRFRNAIAHRWLYGLYGILVVGYALWVASKAMLSPKIYDSGLYHFNTIRWLNEYPLIFGLGNLHGRLAFNQAFFPFVAFLNFFPYINHGHNIANSFLLLLLMAECLHDSLFFIPHIFKTRYYPRSTIFSLFTIPLLLYYSLITDISSPATDSAIFLIQILLLRYLFKLIDSPNNCHDTQMGILKFLLIMSTCAVTCKLSIAVYALTAFLIAVVCELSIQKNFFNFWNAMRRTCIFTAIILLIWMGRGIAQSGVPMYPSTFLRIEADWSVPQEQIQDEANWVYSWARQPKTHWKNVLGNWNWLSPWAKRVSKKYNVTYPLKLWGGGIFFFLCGKLIFKRKTQITINRTSLIGYIPIVSGLCFWFFSAPDPRFAGSLFWLFGMMPWIDIGTNDNYLKRWRIVSVILLGSLIMWPVWNARGLARQISFTGYQPIKRVELATKTTDFGLMLYIPVTGNQCWDSPLPATPYFNPKLRLRGEGLKDGFSVLPPE